VPGTRYEGLSDPYFAVSIRKENQITKRRSYATGVGRTCFFRLESVPLDFENCRLYSGFFSLSFQWSSSQRAMSESAVIRLQSGPSPAPLRLNSGYPGLA
jgi:hypothetical protein